MGDPVREEIWDKIFSAFNNKHCPAWLGLEEEITILVWPHYLTDGHRWRQETWYITHIVSTTGKMNK